MTHFSFLLHILPSKSDNEPVSSCSMVKFLFSKASEQIWVIQKVQKYHQITFYKKISFNPIGRAVGSFIMVMRGGGWGGAGGGGGE